MNIPIKFLWSFVDTYHATADYIVLSKFIWSPRLLRVVILDLINETLSVSNEQKHGNIKNAVLESPFDSTK